MNISKRQADVYKIIADIFLKCIITLVSLGVFIFILYEFFNTECSWESKVPLGVLEALIAGTLYKMFDHFFPKANN